MRGFAGSYLLHMKSQLSYWSAISHFCSLFESKKYADITILCDTREFHVHKCIICVPDSILEKMFDVPCKASLFPILDAGSLANADQIKESENGEVRFEEVSADVIEAILKSLYGVPYSVPDGYESAATFHAEVYAKAAEFELPKVKDRAYAREISRSGYVLMNHRCLCKL